MREFDLIEIVRDWSTMSKEFDQDDGSALCWAKKTLVTRLKLNEAHTEFVYSMIRQLDKNLSDSKLSNITSPIYSHQKPML